MSVIDFAPARREQVKLRGCLIGGPGSGKTLGALTIARALGGVVYGIDTEHGRMKLYADRFEFKHGELRDTSPEGFVAALRVAIGAGADVVIFDSVSHEWLAVLAEADKFGDWKALTPRHNEFVQALVSCPAHVIVTMRAKVKYDVAEVPVPGRDKPRQVITRVGVGPVFREGVEYEFDVLAHLDDQHQATFLNRCDALVGKTMPIPDAVPILLEWLEHGEPDPGNVRAPQEKVTELRALLTAEGQPDPVIDDAFHRTALRSGGVLTLAWVDEKIKTAHERAKNEKPAEAPKPAVVPKTWAEMAAQLAAAFDGSVLDDFEAFVVEAAVAKYGKPVDALFTGSREGNLTRAEWTSLQTLAAGSCARLIEAVDRQFPPPSRAEYRAAFAPAVDGDALDGPPWRLGPEEEDRQPRYMPPEEGQDPVAVGAAGVDPSELDFGDAPGEPE